MSRRYNHNVHHCTPNSSDHDPDIQVLYRRACLQSASLLPVSGVDAQCKLTPQGCVWSDFDVWHTQHMPLFSLSNKVFTGIYSTYYKATLMVDGLSKRFISYQHFTFLPVLLVARFGAPCMFSRVLSPATDSDTSAL